MFGPAVLTDFGVRLNLLTADKIELVRSWRNSQKIQQYMEFRNYITPEMQQRWYMSISTSGKDLYYIISYKSEDVGLINLKDIDKNLLSAEAGVFIYEDKYLNADISYRAHILLFDYFFIEMKYEVIISHILKDNIRAQRFASFLGSIMLPEQETVNNQRWELKRGDYLSNVNRKRFLNRENKLKQINQSEL